MDDEKLGKEILESLIKIHSVIAENQDLRRKQVGDRVLIWDYSYNRDKNTNEEYCNTFKMHGRDAIVIKNDCAEIYIFDGKEIILDLLLHYEDGTEVYCNSDMVRILD